MGYTSNVKLLDEQNFVVDIAIREGSQGRYELLKDYESLVLLLTVIDQTLVNAFTTYNSLVTGLYLRIVQYNRSEIC